MITPSEIDEAAKLFGAPNSQILRDHLISHVIAAIADWPDQNRVTFFGGTALCRTWLPGLRLSEDIDLLLDEPGDSTDIRGHVSRRLRRDFPNLEWTLLGTQHELETWTLATADLDIKVQFAQWRFGWQDTIPTVTAGVQLRYSDLPETVNMTVPDPSGFSAMKLIAWFDRFAPRDLFDLAALADASHISADATSMVKQIAGYTPTPQTLGTTVHRTLEETWQAELGHQLTNTRTAADCLSALRSALERLQ